jgi:hypothetical protein
LLCGLCALCGNRTIENETFDVLDSVADTRMVARL